MKDSGILLFYQKIDTGGNKIFEKKKIKPRITKFAIDAIALIGNKNNKDTLIALQEVIDFMQGKTNTKIKGLVFDNPNSSTVRYMNNWQELKKYHKMEYFLSKPMRK